MATRKRATTSTRKGKASAAPAYFLSLTVENVRCFGSPAQTLDLSDGKGRHAQWTIIVGENGVGKTALLRHIASLSDAKPCFGYGASRCVSRNLCAGEAEDDAPYVGLFDDDGALRDAEKWLLQTDARGGARNARNQITEALRKFFPDVGAIKISGDGRNGFKRRVECKTPCGWVRLSEMGTGHKTFIAWIVDFASRMFDRYPDSPNPLAEPAVCLVDEIDLHLHPTWQRKLIGYLTELFPNTQFIVTAHSPLIVQAATNANIVVLRREGNRVVIDNPVESLKGWSVDQILTSDLYGLASERPPEYDDALAERQRLLSKAELTASDKRRLRTLEAKVEELPVGSTPQDIKAFELVRRFAADLERKGVTAENFSTHDAGQATRAENKRGTKRTPRKKSGAK